jgi:hypothetical protein
MYTLTFGMNFMHIECILYVYTCSTQNVSMYQYHFRVCKHVYGHLVANVFPSHARMIILVFQLKLQLIC